MCEKFDSGFFSKLQLIAIERMLTSNFKELCMFKDDKSKKSEDFKKKLMKLGKSSLKDNKTLIELFLVKNTMKRAILLKESDKAIFITFSF